VEADEALYPHSGINMEHGQWFFPFIVVSSSTFEKKKKNKSLFSWASVTHAYNPSYSGGRDQQNIGSKPAPGK
jgi:hypothetical protein